MNNQDKTGTAGVEGTDFQLNLILICLLRAHKVYGDKFKLTTELASAGKFDDLVFNYFDASGEHVRLLQAKHKTQEKNTITYADLLLQPKSSFDLFQYFKSYKEVILQPEFRDKIEDIILFTNLNINRDVLPFVDVIQRPNDLFYFHTIKSTNTTPILFKFNDQFLDEFQYCRLKNLSKQIIQYGFKKLMMKENNNTFKDFHGILANDVIDIKQAHFKTEFLLAESSLTPITVIFRRIIEQDFLIEYQTLTGLSGSFAQVNSLDRNIFEMKFAPKFGGVLSTDWPKGTMLDATEVDQLKAFLKHLVMAVNQPNEKELVICIQREVESTLKFEKSACEFVTNQLMKNVKDWFKEEKTSYLGKRNVDEFKTYIISRINELTTNKLIIALSHDFCDILDSYKINFHTIQNQGIIENFLQSGSDQICHIRAELDTRVSAIKLFRTFVKINCQNYLFIEFKRNLRKKVLKLLDLFNDSSHFNLLAIECDSQDQYDLFHDELSDIFDYNFQKKLIVITNEIVQFNTFKYPILEIKDNLVFSDLTNDSQQYLLEQTVLFQGYKVKLQDITDRGLCMDSWKWKNLINDSLITISEELQFTKGYDERYYINRMLVYNTPSFDRNLSSKLGPHNALVFTEKEFQEHCLNHPQKNIHLMTETVNKTYIWRKTRGSISVLRPHIKEMQTSYIRDDQSNLLDGIDSKILIISDTAGMGKSTLFSRLSKGFKNRDPRVWVVRVNLIGSNTVLNEFQADLQNKSSVLSDEVVNFLIHKILKLNCPMEIALFRQFMLDNGTNTKRVILLFDGFDEMIQECHDILLRIMKYLVSNSRIQLIGISTRPHLQSILEENFQQFATTMQPFTEENKTHFLYSYWMTCYEGKYNTKAIDKALIGGRLKTYAEMLLVSISDSLNDQQSQLTGIPLQLKMIAEVYEEEALVFADSSVNVAINNHLPLSVVELYRKFFEKKEQIYIKEKANSGDSNFITNSLLKRNVKMIMDTQKNLALINVFPHFDAKGMDQLKDTFEDLLIFGLVQESDGKYWFIHQTFAEYLVAVYTLEKFDESSVFKEILFQLILIGDQYQVVRTFVDQIIQSTGYENILTWMKENGTDEQLVNVNQIFLKSLTEELLRIIEFTLNFCQHKSAPNAEMLIVELVKFTQMRWKCTSHGYLLDWIRINYSTNRELLSQILSSSTTTIITNACHKNEAFFGITSTKPQVMAQQLVEFLTFLKDTQILEAGMLDQSIVFPFQAIQISPYFRFDGLEIYLNHIYENHLELLNKLILRIGQMWMHSGEKQFVAHWLNWLHSKSKISSDVVLELLVGKEETFKVRRLYWDVKYENNLLIEKQLNIVRDHLQSKYLVVGMLQLDSEYSHILHFMFRDLFECCAWSSTDRVFCEWIKQNCAKDTLGRVLYFPNNMGITIREYYALWSRLAVLEHLLNLSSAGDVADEAASILINLRNNSSNDGILNLMKSRNLLQESILQKACKEKANCIIDVIASWFPESETDFDEIVAIRVQTFVRFDMELLKVVREKFPHYIKRFLLNNKEFYYFPFHSSNYNFHYDALDKQVLDTINTLSENSDVIELLGAKSNLAHRTLLHRYVEEQNPEMLYQLIKVVQDRQLEQNEIFKLFQFKDVHGRSICSSAAIMNNKKVNIVLKEFSTDYFSESQISELQLIDALKE